MFSMEDLVDDVYQVRKVGRLLLRQFCSCRRRCSSSVCGVARARGVLESQTCCCSSGRHNTAQERKSPANVALAGVLKQVGDVQRVCKVPSSVLPTCFSCR